MFFIRSKSLTQNCSDIYSFNYFILKVILKSMKSELKPLLNQLKVVLTCTTRFIPALNHFLELINSDVISFYFGSLNIQL